MTGIKMRSRAAGEGSRQGVPGAVTQTLGALLLPLLTGCLTPRLTALEARLEQEVQARTALEASFEGQVLRFDSVATGLEKLNERLEASIPSSAQWLSFRPGAALKWYYDGQDEGSDPGENVYLRFVEIGADRGSVVITLTTKAGSHQHLVRPGEAVEHRWDSSDSSLAFVITCHRILYSSDQSMYGLFSLLERPETAR